MEPILPAPHQYESSPNPSSAEGDVSALPPISPENDPNIRPEGTKEQYTAPVSPSNSQATQPFQPQPITVQTGKQSTNDSSGAHSAVAGAPLIADDVDVIEKEWVDKAKMIVNATRDDPHQQEKEVSKLQADYMMKRYNKQIKLTE